MCAQTVDVISWLGWLYDDWCVLRFSPCLRAQTADVLSWLSRLYDAGADIPQDIDSEQERVFFIKAMAQVCGAMVRVC